MQTQPVKVRVLAVVPHQFGMAPGFDDPAGIHHHDPVCMVYR